MSRVPGWLGKLGASLTEMSERLDARQAEVSEEDTAPAPEPARREPVMADAVSATAPDAVSATATAPDTVADAVPHARRPLVSVPLVPRPDPAQAVPWGVRVAAEAGWRLLVLASTVWVLMRVISAVQLVVFAFVIALLITALLQPTVARLTRRGVPRGPATALTAISGFVVIGLMGWFVTWQVMENIDTLSTQIQSGIDDLRNWLLKSPF
ncbi:AI-2E family transporter, partial [Streptomyces murinus]|uniref:AI-2E family transporter n=1 Tax=Streptomyces murinus TaxID=33900 RepID=UPI003F47FD03